MGVKYRNGQRNAQRYYPAPPWQLKAAQQGRPVLHVPSKEMSNDADHISGRSPVANLIKMPPIYDRMRPPEFQPCPFQ